MKTLHFIRPGLYVTAVRTKMSENILKPNHIGFSQCLHLLTYSRQQAPVPPPLFAQLLELLPLPPTRLKFTQDGRRQHPQKCNTLDFKKYVCIFLHGEQEVWQKSFFCICTLRLLELLQASQSSGCIYQAVKWNRIGNAQLDQAFIHSITTKWNRIRKVCS